jgi:hypothetical protein
MSKIILVNFPFVHVQKSNKGVSQFQFESRGKNMGTININIPFSDEILELKFKNQKQFNKLLKFSKFLRENPFSYYQFAC